MTNDQIKTFIQGGNAIFTLESKKTGAHYTFRARKVTSSNTMFWISLLTAPDTYTYVGTARLVNLRWSYNITKKSIPTHKIHSVLKWFFNLLDSDKKNESLIFRHAGKCSRCSRTLTTPASLDAGMGPTCLAHLTGEM